jgi:hypothetical protein
VTILINGKAIRTTMSPGDADSYSEAVTQTLGGTVTVTANAYLPIKGLQSNAVATDAFPEECLVPPPPYQTTVTELTSFASNQGSNSGSVYSIAYPNDVITNPRLVPKCRVNGGGLDDSGSIGGVGFKNNVPCHSISTIRTPTEVSVVKDGARLRVDWSTQNDAKCKGPTGLSGVSFTFYWIVID